MTLMLQTPVSSGTNRWSAKSISINTYIKAETSCEKAESMRFCQVAHCMTFFSFRYPPHLNLAFMSNYLSNGKCIYFNVLIKFKEFVYIYNFTCFELIRMDLKNHGKCRNQKKISIFYIRLTSMQNCKSRIQLIW